MEVCLGLFCVLCALRWADPRQRSPTDFLKLRNWIERKRYTDSLCSKWEQQERERGGMGLENEPELKWMWVTSEKQFYRPWFWCRCSFFVGCGCLKRYNRARNRLWQFPRQKRALGVRVGRGVQQTERVQFRIYGRPEQSHNKSVSRSEQSSQCAAMLALARRDRNEMWTFQEVFMKHAVCASLYMTWRCIH
jgi:hypothetical protein